MMSPLFHTSTQANRRQTICPGLLSRDVPSSTPAVFSQAMLNSANKMALGVNSFTPNSQKRVTFALSPSLVSPFQPRFDRQSFEEHLKDVQVCL